MAQGVIDAKNIQTAKICQVVVNHAGLGRKRGVPLSAFLPETEMEKESRPQLTADNIWRLL